MPIYFQINICSRKLDYKVLQYESGNGEPVCYYLNLWRDSGIPANCHTFGVFLLIFDLTSGFATHSLIVTHSEDLPLIFEEMPLILMIFATHFHAYRLRGCEM